MSTTGKLSLRPPTPRSVTTADSALVDILRTRGNWIWIDEPGRRAPSAPDFEQRAFRKVFTFPSSKGKPTSCKFVVGADDYFAFYVNGVLVQPADGTHDWQTFIGFQVPLPVIKNTTTDTMTLAFRVVNRLGNAGLLVGAQVTYESGDPDTFYTGMDDSWTTERSFDEGWEQPWYSPPGLPRAAIFPQDVRGPSEPNDIPNIGVFEQLPADVTPGPSTTECAAAGERSAPINLTVGGFIGAIIGTAIAALAIGALASFFVMRKRERKARRHREGLNGGVAIPLMSEPTTVPGRQIYHTSDPSNEFGPAAVGSLSSTRYDAPSHPHSHDEAPSTHLTPYGAHSTHRQSESAYAEPQYSNHDEVEPPTYADDTSSQAAPPRPVHTGKRARS